MRLIRVRVYSFAREYLRARIRVYMEITPLWLQRSNNVVGVHRSVVGEMAMSLAHAESH